MLVAQSEVDANLLVGFTPQQARARTPLLLRGQPIKPALRWLIGERPDLPHDPLGNPRIENRLSGGYGLDGTNQALADIDLLHQITVRAGHDRLKNDGVVRKSRQDDGFGVDRLSR